MAIAFQIRIHYEQEGYDLVEIGEKLADNYVRQIMQDGIFPC